VACHHDLFVAPLITKDHY